MRVAATMATVSVLLLAGCSTSLPGEDHAATGGERRAFRFVGADVVGGLAPMGLPAVPVFVDEEGRVGGRTNATDPFIRGGSEGRATLPVLEWLGYCGNEDSPALHASQERDDTFRYWTPEDSEWFDRLWFRNKSGEPVVADEFPVGEAAWVTWRSEGLDYRNRTILLLVRLAPGAEVTGAAASRPPSDFRHPQGFVAVSARSTEFCSIASWSPWSTYGRARTEDTDHALVIDHVHVGLWDARRLVPDVGVSPMPPPNEW